MLANILLAVAVVVVVCVAVVAMRPSECRVARTALIGAPASAVFERVNDFHNWEAWSPWAKRDPAMKKGYGGAPAGTRPNNTWAGNTAVGAGRTTKTPSPPSELIRIRLEMMRPFAATNTVEFAFRPEGNHTAVTWSMVGESGFIGKALGLFMNMDKMVGGDFEKGLTQMKSVAEAAAKR